ncbi:protein kinase [Candidatus Uabimicrobium sp. HlEnr_7]|uniref:serine/threonine-protein kinase n=1 Tax=Candidatus Uabimicrobium helgolandensis TaxID=3095367 RepID=UPI00355752E6
MKNIVLNNRYQLQKILGQGGMGKVYLALDMKENRLVAVKECLLTQGENCSKKIERFKREYYFLKKANHDNIVKAIELLNLQHSYFLIMEFVSGPDLLYIIRNQRFSLDIFKQIDIAIQICSAVAYLNNNGVIHRDIKPSNIIICEGQVKLLDLGIAKSDEESLVTLTNTDSVVGTPSYISPEQVEGGVHKNSDVFSLGAMFHQFFTWESHSPFYGGTYVSTINKIVNTKLPLLSECSEQKLPQQLTVAIEQAVEKNGDNRISSEELEVKLKGIQKFLNVSTNLKATNISGRTSKIQRSSRNQNRKSIAKREKTAKIKKGHREKTAKIDKRQREKTSINKSRSAKKLRTQVQKKSQFSMWLSVSGVAVTFIFFLLIFQTSSKPQTQYEEVEVAVKTSTADKPNKTSSLEKPNKIEKKDNFSKLNVTKNSMKHIKETSTADKPNKTSSLENPNKIRKKDNSSKLSVTKNSTKHIKETSAKENSQETNGKTPKKQNKVPPKKQNNPKAKKKLTAKQRSTIYSQAYANFNARKFHIAIDLFSKLIDHNPNDIVSLNSRGLAYHNTQQFELSIKDQNACIQKSITKSYKFYNSKAVSYRSMGKNLEAIKACEQGLLISENPKGYHIMGLSYISLEKYKFAIDSYSKAIDLDPKYRKAYYHRGRVYYTKGNFNKALPDFNAMLKLNNKDSSAYKSRGLVYFYTQKYQLALDDWDKAVAISPHLSKSIEPFRKNAISKLKK